MRRFSVLAAAVVLVLTATLAPCLAQTNPNAPSQPATPPAKTLGRVDKEDIPKEQKKSSPNLAKANATPTGEQVAELVILVTVATREVQKQIRRNGVERGSMTRASSDGRTEEVTYEQRFVHGETAAKDKIRLDQKTPANEFALIYNEGQVWGVINGTAFTPREEAAAEFLSRTRHGLDALLRYKENGSTVTFVSKDKQKNIDMWLVDLTDKDKQTTRYYVSARSGNVLALEYEETPPGADKPVKFRRTFHDYRRVQGTNVPYRTVLYQNDKQTEETRVLTVTYGIRMDDTYFQNPQAAANSSQF
ncbi:MAG TPA: hypothetical protein VF525_17305 [Pyrinomonadaceae bacterium]|jgi:hypothetical protein